MRKIFTILFYSEVMISLPRVEMVKTHSGFSSQTSALTKRSSFTPTADICSSPAPLGSYSLIHVLRWASARPLKRLMLAKGMIDGLFDGERRFGWESEDRGAAHSQMHHSSQTCEGFCSLYIKVYREIHQQMLVYQRRSGCHCVWLLNG